MFVAALVTSGLAAAPRWHQLTTAYTYDEYLRDFHKVPASDPAERNARQAEFSRRVAAAVAHNAAGVSTYKRGVNHMTDFLPHERARLRGRKHSTQPRSAPVRATAVPATLDWRTATPFTVVAAIRNQGDCGSCWAVAAAETIESRLSLATNGTLVLVSAEHLVACVANPNQCGGTGGCEGATESLAYNFTMVNGGLAEEWAYPYTSYHGKTAACHHGDTYAPRTVGITNYVEVAPNHEDSILAAIQSGPISLGAAANMWDDYETGIFDGCVEEPDYGMSVNHAVQLVAYSPDYWVIRNSWSALWGEQGYIRLPRADRKCYTDLVPTDGAGCKGGPPNVTVCGACGMFYQAAYPTGVYPILE